MAGATLCVFECQVLFVNIPPMTAELLLKALIEDGVVWVVGKAQNLSETQLHLQAHPTRTALVGSRSGREHPTGLPFVENISALSPQTRQIILGQDLSEEDELILLRAGVRGLLRESETTLQVLSKCIRSVAAGQVWANSAQLERLLDSLSSPRSLRVTNALGAAILSRREEEVLNLLAEGLTNRELATCLKLSEHTVKNHLFRIFDKLGVSSRMEAVLYAMNQPRFSAFPPPISPGVLVGCAKSQ